MKAVSGIYKITCIVTDKAYIGKFKGIIKQRVMQHLNGKSPECKAIHRAVKKYGKENFTWDVLHENVIPELLPLYEIEAIKIHKTKAPHGYNLTDGGEGSLNPTKETIEKRRQKMIGKKVSKETRQKISRSHFGIRPNAETRAKQSAAKKGKPSHMKGKTHSKKTRKKISIAHAGKTIPTETRQKISATMSKIRTSPHFQSFCDYFQSLPDNMPIPEKRKMMINEFKGVVNKHSIYKWVQKLLPPNLDPDTLKSYRPEYHDAKTFYFSLPKDMHIQEKRKRLFSEFSDVPKFTIREWVRKWSGIMTSRGTPRHPKYDDVHQYFSSLPSEMSLEEKRLQCYAQFPDVLLSTIYQWICKWHPNDSAFQKRKRKKRAYEIYLSLEPSLTQREKVKRICDAIPNSSYTSVDRWVKRWQSSL